jgi:hypothetical protein
MKSSVCVLAALLLAGVALAGEVYVTRDTQGNAVYTDKPETIPAERVGMHSSSSGPAEVQPTKNPAKDEEGARAAEAESAEARERQAALQAEDRAHRCKVARDRYQNFTAARRMYEQDSEGERRYLTSEEVDAARARAKQTMDEFCGAD